jgi:predicted metal-dependent peptidase
MPLALEKIERAGVKMLLAYPWWASLYLNLQRVESTDIPTMAVDGTHLFYNPSFVEKLTDEECMGVLMHETGHIALLHCYRRAYRDPIIWNIAADEKVNALLVEDRILLPKGCIPPTSLDETVEEAYDRILKSCKKYSSFIQDVLASEEQQKEGNADSGTGNGESRKTEKEWRSILAQNRGLAPASIARTVSENAEPQINWKEYLSQFVHSTRRANDRTWNRPSRRQLGMPGWKRDPENTVAICIDTSGSITDVLLAEFLAELKAICAVSYVSAHVISCDAAVHQVIPPGESIPVLRGGGGTNFCPALLKAEELEVDAAIYFTDADGTFPDECRVPVLWALTKRATVPFGQSILIRRIAA